MNRILVVEDDTSISNVIEISLRNAGYLCDCVYDADYPKLESALLISCGKGFRWELTFLMWVVLLRNRRVREVLRKQTIRINIQCMLILDYSILMR